MLKSTWGGKGDGIIRYPGYNAGLVAWRYYRYYRYSRFWLMEGGL